MSEFRIESTEPIRVGGYYSSKLRVFCNLCGQEINQLNQANTGQLDANAMLHMAQFHKLFDCTGHNPTAIATGGSSR